MSINNTLNGRVGAVLVTLVMVLSTLVVMPDHAQGDQFPPQAWFSDTMTRTYDSTGDGLEDSMWVRYKVQTDLPTNQVTVRFSVYDGDDYLWDDQISNFRAYSRDLGPGNWNEFSFSALFSGTYRASLTVAMWNTPETIEETMEIEGHTLEVDNSAYDLVVHARAYDDQGIGVENDVEVTVYDYLGNRVSGYDIFMDRYVLPDSFDGVTATYLDIWEKGWHEIDVFLGGVHANTDFYSDGGGGILTPIADADPMDYNEDGIYNDVLIRAEDNDGNPVRQATVELDGVEVGNTDMRGVLLLRDVDGGWHDIHVYEGPASPTRDDWTYFFSEKGINDLYDEYFAHVEWDLIDLDGSRVRNDLDIRVDVDLADPVTVDVSVRADLYFGINGTRYTGTEKTFQITDGETMFDHLFITDVPFDVYDLVLLLTDGDGNFEDQVFIEDIMVMKSFNFTNVDHTVLDMDGDDQLNDVLLWAHVMENPVEGLTVRVFRDSPPVQVGPDHTTDEDGYCVVSDLDFGHYYNWSVLDDEGNEVDNGGIRIYEGWYPITQTRAFLHDLNGDGFFDDFVFQAFYDNDLGTGCPTVFFYVWDEEDESMFTPLGFEITGDTDNPPQGFPDAGSVYMEGLLEGNYTFEAWQDGLKGSGTFLCNGTFYSYGNSTETVKRINVQVEMGNYDGGTGNNDALITVTDEFGLPVSGAWIVVDLDYERVDITNAQGQRVFYNFISGWHEVDVFSGVGFVDQGITGIMPIGRGYSRFHSEGLDAEIFRVGFNRVALEDEEFDDLEVMVWAIITEVPRSYLIEEEVESLINLTYTSNGTLIESVSVPGMAMATEWYPYRMIATFPNLTYDESYTAECYLYDKYGELMDNRTSSPLLLSQIKPVINMKRVTYLGSDTPTNNTFQFLPNIAGNVNPSWEFKVELYDENSVLYATNYSDYSDPDLEGVIQFFEVEPGEYTWKAFKYDPSEDAWVGGEDQPWNGTVSVTYTGEYQLANVRDENYDGIYSDFYYYSDNPYRDRLFDLYLYTPTGPLYTVLYDQKYAMIYDLKEGEYYFEAIETNPTPGLMLMSGSFYSYGNGSENSLPIIDLDDYLEKHIFEPGEDVSVDLSDVEDPDGDNLTFQWTLKDAEGEKVYQHTGEVFEYTFPGNASGTYTLLLYWTDGYDFDQDGEDLYVSSGNIPPVADAGENITAAVDSLVTLNGNGSYDPDGEIVEYDWECTSHDNITLNLTDPIHPTFTTNETGNYTFSLRVKDNASAWSQPDTVFVFVVDNQPPVADAGEDFQAAVDTLIVLNGSNSTDPDGEIVDYAWECTSHDNVTLNLTDPVHPTFTPNATGEYTFQLTVTDEGNLSNTDEVVVTVAGEVNLAPVAVIASPVADEEYFDKVATSFDAEGSSDPDGDDTNLTYLWTSDVDGELGTEKTFERTLTAGTHLITLTVTDEANASDVAQVTIDVLETPNLPPEAVISSPKDNSTTNKRPTLDGSGSSDPDGDPLNFAWFNGEEQLGEGEMLDVDLEEGDYSITLWVDDGTGTDGHNVSAVVNFTVEDAAPVTKFSVDANRKNIGETFTFDGDDTTDADDDVEELEFSWDFGDGTTGSGSTAEHAYDEAGTFTVTLNVTDGDRSSEATKELTVNTPPVAEAGEDITVTEGVETQFNGTGSSDDDEDSLTYSWDFGDGEEGSGAEPKHTYEEAGTYTVTLNVTDGLASASDTLTVTVEELVVVNQEPTTAINSPSNGTEIRKGESVLFVGSGTDPEGDTLTYTWDFGDGGTASGMEANHEFSSTGDFTVTLTVEDIGGLTAEASITVTVIEAVPASPVVGSPGDGETVSGTVTISGTLDDDLVDAVEVQIDDLGWNTANLLESRGSREWYYDWDSTDVDDGDHTIYIRSMIGDTPSEEVSLAVTVDNVDDDAEGEAEAESESEDEDDDSEDDDESDDEADDEEEEEDYQEEGKKDFMSDPVGYLSDNPTYLAVLVLVIVLIIVVIAGMVSSSRRRRKRAKTPPKTPPKPPVSFKKAEKEEEEEEEFEIRRIPIRCPDCDHLFIGEDDGTRPLPIECPSCGSQGMIPDSALEKLPWEKDEDDMEKGMDKETLPPVRTHLTKCPSCSEIFSYDEDQMDVICPVCGVRGRAAPSDMADPMGEDQDDPDDIAGDKEEPEEIFDDDLLNDDGDGFP